MNSSKTQYAAFLRGINVGGHHKVPMADLRKEMEAMGFQKVITLLNSGNILFEAASDDIVSLERRIAAHLEKAFGFPIPTILRKVETIEKLLAADPFDGIALTKELRFYVSFLPKAPETDLPFPWESEDGSFKVLTSIDHTIVSVLDLSVTKTPKAMEVLEKFYGKGITTRNWNTILRIEKKLA